MSNSSNSWFDNFLATHQRPNQKGQAPSTGQKTQSGNSWFDDFLSTHQRPKQKEETPAGVKPLPVVGGNKPILESVERDDGIFSMQVPQKKAQTAPEETPAAGKPVFDRDQWLQDYAKEAERIFSPDQQDREEKKPEETPAPVQQSAPKSKDEWQALYNNSTSEMERLEKEWQALTDKMSGGMPSAEDQQRLDELQKQYKEAVTNRDAADNQLKQIGNNEVMRADLEILASWPEEDRQMLIQYALNDHKGRSVFERSSESATRAATALVELQKKYDKDTIKRLSESYQWYQNEIATNTMRDEAAREVQGKPGAAIVHSALTLPATVAGTVTAPLDYLGQVFGRTGRYSTLDPNARGNLPNVYSGAVRQQVASDIAGDGSSVGRKAASYLYQGGMSALDTGARLLVTGGNAAASATLAALGSFGNTVSEASTQGATPAQAMAYGIVAAGIEVATEKMELDELVGVAKGGWKGLKPALVSAFKQAGVEVAEEELSLIGTTLMELLILQEKASTNQRIQQLVAEEGMSVEEAKNQVMYELLGEAMDTAVVSAISGGLSSAGGSTVAYMGRDTGGAQTAQEGAEAAQRQETTVAEVTADTATDQQQTQAEEPQNNVRKAVQEFRDTGKVSNRMAEVILNDAESVAALQKETGMELPDTASGRRNAVKDAVAQLSRNEDAKDLTSSTAEALLRKQEQPQEAKAEDPEETRRLAIEATRELQGLTMQETVENVDTSLNGQYNNDIKDGGNYYAGNQGLSGIDEAGLPGGTGAGRIRGMGTEQIPGNGQASRGMETGGDLGPGSMEAGSRGGGYEVQLRVSPVLRVSDNLSTAQKNRGTPTYQVRDTTGQPKIYAAALVDGRNSDPVNGWCVTPKSAQELAEGSVRTLMNDTGTVGVGVAEDGDIVAVFKNKNGGPKRALDTAMPIAIEQGGDRLDCYGEGLVRAYENYGFVPVARVEFNPKYANDGWTPDKGTPYIYFMMHNGDSSAEVVEKMHSYPHKTKAELEALPTYGKDDYDAAMEYRNGLMDQRSADMDHGAVGAADGDYGDNTVGSAESRFRHEVRRSKVYDNTYKNATSKRVREVGKKTKKLDKKIAEYDYISEDESVYNALQRVRETGTDVFSYSHEAVEAEYAYLVEKEGWTGEDNDTATLVLDYLMENGEMEKLRTLAKKKRENITAAAQLVQSQAKYTRPETPREAAYDAAATLEDLTEQDVPKKFYKEQGFENWKNGITNAILDIADDMEDISDNDAASMRGIIRQLANLRKTTAWMGYSSNLTKAADRMVNKLDYKTAKDIAMAQLSMIPNDYRKRSAGQIVKTIRIQNMLSGLTTVLRNGAGNTSIALMDAVADSTGGMMADMIMAKFTGIRTVNSEMKYTKEYFSAAEDAVDMAALCVELDIPMETEAAYSVGKTRNFSPQSGLVGRFLSSYEKYLKYALEVSDKFFESGASSSVSRSIQELGEKSGLNEAQIKELGEYVGKRRTYKEGRKLARANTKLKGALNEIGTEDFGAGDVLMPFAGVPGDVAQVGADYSGLGALEGFVEMAKIIADKKAGKEIDPVRQRKAATDFGRGVSGVGLVAVSTLLATMGLIKVSEEPDKDKRGLAQALGLSGAQFNLTAIGRLIKGESTDWQDDDIVVNVDFLQPFNSQMYIGYLMAQEDSVGEMIAAYPKSGFRGMLQSILDMPMMTTVSDMADLATSFGEVSEDGNFDAVKDAGGQLLGDIATGFIPSWFRQVAQYVDPYYRDTSGDDALQKAWNRFISAVPFASKTLPKKYSGLGEEQLRYEDSALGFFNTFINPGAITQISGSEITDYLDTLDDVTVYPEYMAPNSITVNGEKIPISGKEMTEKYQKTYGEKVANLYGALIDSSDFNKLPKEMQIEALKQAKEYATDFAKAAVADKAEKPSVDMRNPAQYIVRKVTLSDITKSVSDVNEALDNDWDTTEAALSMETAWKAYNRLSKEAQAAIRDDAGGSAAGKYIAAREAGVTNSEYVALLRNVSALKPQSGYSNVRDIQKAQAVGKMSGLSNAEKEAMVRGYVSDGQDKNIDDMKDLFRDKNRSFSVNDYLTAWAISDKESGKGRKDRIIAEYRKRFNLDEATAEELYKIFG